MKDKEKLIIICLIFTLLFTTIASQFSFSYAENDILNNINIQETSEGILYTIGDEWELLETKQGTIVNKMPQDIESKLANTYVLNKYNEIDHVQKVTVGDIVINYLGQKIAALVWEGGKWVVVSLISGNPVPAAIVVLSITLAAVSTMALRAIYLVGKEIKPVVSRVVSKGGCISRDSGRTWICPYRFMF